MGIDKERYQIVVSSISLVEPPFPESWGGRVQGSETETHISGCGLNMGHWVSESHTDTDLEQAEC